MPQPYFIKNEASFPLTDGNITNYTGLGVKTTNAGGSYESMIAFKVTEDSKGGFYEFKYTTPKLGKSDIAFESRSRAIFDDKSGNSVTERAALKYSKNLGKNFNIYEIAGANTEFTKKGFVSVSPTLLSGVGYNINKNLNIYMEADVSKSYNAQNKSWGDINSNLYFGAKFTF